MSYVHYFVPELCLELAETQRANVQVPSPLTDGLPFDTPTAAPGADQPTTLSAPLVLPSPTLREQHHLAHASTTTSTCRLDPACDGTLFRGCHAVGPATSVTESILQLLGPIAKGLVHVVPRIVRLLLEQTIEGVPHADSSIDECG